MAVTPHVDNAANQKHADFTVAQHTGRLIPKLWLGTSNLRTHTVQT